MAGNDDEVKDIRDKAVISGQLATASQPTCLMMVALSWVIQGD